MKRIFLTAAGLIAFMQSHAQDIDTGFQSRQLKVEEVNLVSSYYMQNGNNSAVTGGIGTEKLTDLANVLDVKLTRYDKKLRKNTYDVEVGLDHYTSASSDMIDLRANSSASHADTRFYPSLSWSIENDKKGTTLTSGLSLSTEFDYISTGGNISFSKKTRNRNGEFTAKVQAYLDQVTLVTPVELRTSARERDYATTPRNSFVGSFSYSQIINERLQIILLADIVKQQGYLSLPFHRVYFDDASVHQEALPSTRLKIPLGMRANYFLGDRIILRTYYRYYFDDWGIKSHSANLEVAVKITPFVSVSPFYRYYEQTAADYFAPYQKHTVADQYYTSNYDLSRFNSSFFGAGIRLAPPKGVFGIQHLSMLELRYGHYKKSSGMQSNIISMNLKFK